MPFLIKGKPLFGQPKGPLAPQIFPLMPPTQPKARLEPGPFLPGHPQNTETRLNPESPPRAEPQKFAAPFQNPKGVFSGLLKNPNQNFNQFFRR